MNMDQFIITIFNKTAKNKTMIMMLIFQQFYWIKIKRSYEASPRTVLTAL